MGMNEADTRYHLIDPLLRDKGYVSRERVTLETVLTPPPVEPSGPKGRRRKGPGRTDYLLCVQVGDMPKCLPVAVLEAKKEAEDPLKGMQQARGYADTLRYDVKYVFSTNGHRYGEYDRVEGTLAEAEAARHAAQSQRGEADTLLAAIYREAFEQVVPVAVPPTFDEPPPGWGWHKLTDLARLESGHTPSRSRPDWWGGDVSWISLTEIRALDGKWVQRTQLRTNADGIANSAARILPRGTVCFSRTASVGFVTIIGRPMATSQDFANWVCSDALDPEFLMHALIRSRRELRELATGATHKTIYMPTLESFCICAPDPDAQRRIVRALEERLNETTVLREALDVQEADLAALPQRLLAQAFGASA